MALKWLWDHQNHWGVLNCKVKVLFIFLEDWREVQDILNDIYDECLNRFCMFSKDKDPKIYNWWNNVNRILTSLVNSTIYSCINYIKWA